MIVICHTEDVFISVLFHNAACLANACFTPDIYNFQLAKILAVLFFQKCLPGLLNTRQMQHRAWTLPHNFGIGCTVFDHCKNRFRLLDTAVRFLRQFTGFFKRFRLIRLGFAAFSPFAFFADIIPVFAVRTSGGFNVRAIKAALHHGKLFGIFKCDIEVSMICRAFFVAHAPIDNAGNFLQNTPDALMVIIMLLRIIECQLKFAIGFSSSHCGSFLSLRIISFQNYNPSSKTYSKYF